MNNNLITNSQSSKISRLILLIILLGLIAIASVPGYVQGKWSWSHPPIITNLNQIKQIRETGLNIPNWTTEKQQIITIGGKDWSIQALTQGDSQSIQLLLLPPNDHKAQPSVEWTDIKGFFNWKTDSHQNLTINLDSKPITIEYFRAWTKIETFAVLQWYAFPQGGNPSPSNWFWQDQLAQLHKQRVPWIAVSLHIPIEPLGDIKQAQPLAESLARTIEQQLSTNYLITSGKN